MKKKSKKIRASIILVNFNNSKYLVRCLKSLKNQSNKNFEVIFVDDQSTDNSVSNTKKFFKKNNFLKSKILVNKNKTKFGSYNQINCIVAALNKCKNNIILFLDSDDFFLKDKVKETLKFFEKNKNINFTFDLPYKLINNKKIKFKLSYRSKFLIPWPSFPSQSCIIVKKNYLKKILASICKNSYPNIWFDFRIIMKAFYDFGTIKHINQYLTCYRQNLKGESIKFKKLSKNWWLRRKEAHIFIKKEIFKNSRKNFSVDYFISSFINFFILNEK